MECNGFSIFSLEGKVALVTGASRGLGRKIALGYSMAGATVVVSARDTDRLQQVVDEMITNGGRGLAVKCDVGEEKELLDLVKTTLDHYGSLDILVNNAGIGPYGKRAVDVTKEMWEEIFRINLLGPFLLCREAAKLMIPNQWGRIINMASASAFVGFPRQVAYSSLKAALIQMTRTLAVEYAKYGITVNAIAPSILATDLTKGVRESEQHAKQFLQKVPLGCFGKADDTVGASIYLASEASRYVTGTTMVIDGGMLA